MTKKGTSSMASIAELSSALRDFRRRPATIRDIVDQGKKSVKPMIDLLASGDDVQRWCAARVLGDLGDESALDALRVAYKDAHLSAIAAQSIKKLTGEAPTEDHGGGDPFHVDAGAVRHSDGELMTACQESLGATYEPIPNGYEVMVPIPDAEPQRVAVHFPESLEGSPLVVVSCETGVEAQPKLHEKVLVWNARLAYGAIALTTTKAQMEYVLVDRHRRETLDPLELSKSLRGIARYADKIRKRLAEAAPGATQAPATQATSVQPVSEE